jgi:hypothetical protein
VTNTEFPDFDYDLPIIEGFEDTSWHNDVCPSLTRKSPDESKTLILWCDYADATKRESYSENPPYNGKRYTLTRGEYTDDPTTLCESDDLADILAVIAANTPSHA